MQRGIALKIVQDFRTIDTFKSIVISTLILLDLYPRTRVTCRLRHLPPHLFVTASAQPELNNLLTHMSTTYSRIAANMMNL